MPSVGDLDNATRALADAVGINPSSIARDNLDTRVIAQPSGHRCRFAIW